MTTKEHPSSSYLLSCLGLRRFKGYAISSFDNLGSLDSLAGQT